MTEREGELEGGEREEGTEGDMEDGREEGKGTKGDGTGGGGEGEMQLKRRRHIPRHYNHTCSSTPAESTYSRSDSASPRRSPTPTP